MSFSSASLTDDEKLLRKRFNARWRNIVKKTEQVEHLQLPDKEELWSKVLKKFRDDWRCTYCSQDIKIKDTVAPYYQSFSIDHRTSVDLGGSNHINNLEVVCTRCNIIKSTMRAETYIALLASEEPLISKPDLMDRVYKELWSGQLANKLEREEEREKNAADT